MNKMKYKIEGLKETAERTRTFWVFTYTGKVNGKEFSFEKKLSRGFSPVYGTGRDLTDGEVKAIQRNIKKALDNGTMVREGR